MLAGAQPKQEVTDDLLATAIVGVAQKRCRRKGGCVLRLGCTIKVLLQWDDSTWLAACQMRNEKRPGRLVYERWPAVT